MGKGVPRMGATVAGLRAKKPRTKCRTTVHKLLSFMKWVLWFFMKPVLKEKDLKKFISA